MDETVCVFPLAGTSLIITFECLNPLAPYQELVLECCASIYVAVAVCTLICIESAGLGCIVCIIGGVYGVEDALTDCYRGCPAMDVCVRVLWVTVACAKL